MSDELDLEARVSLTAWYTYGNQAPPRCGNSRGRGTPRGKLRMHDQSSRLCARCGAVFSTTSRKTRYCSTACRYATRIAPVENLWQRAIPDAKGCLVWTGAVTSKGYGWLRIGGRRCYAHRAAYELKVGAIPAGLTIDHLCRNRRCINVDHLEPVSARTNVLRGVGTSAQNARKTHCVHGHPFDEANTHLLKDGKRVCRACRREAWHRRKGRAA